MSPPLDPMELAFEEANKAAARGEVPIGAVLADAAGNVIAAAGNEVEARHDPTAHAEVLVLRKGGEVIGAPRLPDCDLYVTLEPCPMCATAASFARVRRVIFAAYDPKGGGIEHGARVYQQPTCHHRPDVVGGVQAARADVLLKQFFAARR